MPLQTFNYAALPLRRNQYDWMGNIFENMLKGYKMAGEPARINRADERDKVDTEMYRPTKEQEYLKMLLGNRGLELGNQRDEATLPFAGPTAQANLRARQLGNQKLDMEIPLTKQQMMVDMLYKRAMANRLLNPGKQGALSGNEMKAIKGAMGYENSDDGESSQYVQLTKPQLNQLQQSVNALRGAQEELKEYKDYGKYLGAGKRFHAMIAPYSRYLGDDPSILSDRQDSLTHGNLAIEKLMKGAQLPAVKEAVELLKNSIHPVPGENQAGFEGRIQKLMDHLAKVEKENASILDRGIRLPPRNQNQQEGLRSIPSVDQLMNSKEDPSQSADPRIRQLANHFSQTMSKANQMVTVLDKHTGQRIKMTRAEAMKLAGQ